MVGHGTKFGRKKEQAIAALLSHRSIEDAARAIGVVPNTLIRWMRQREFDAAYREARRLAFRQSIARLQQASSAAVSTLLKVMVDANAPASTRRRNLVPSETATLGDCSVKSVSILVFVSTIWADRVHVTAARLRIQSKEA